MRRAGDSPANHKLLDELTALAAEVEAGAAASVFRFGASRAYEEIVEQRLQTIGERKVGGLPTWSSFLARRMKPALRTCVTTEARQSSLSLKLARAANLLRTRVDVELEQQNQELLKSMNARTRLQLRLQTTVEGLSVAAITYYVVGLFGYLVKAAHDSGRIRVEPSIATAAFVPIAGVRRSGGPCAASARSTSPVKTDEALASDFWQLRGRDRDRAISAATGQRRRLASPRPPSAETPVTIFQPQSAAPAPVVVIAHGFAGSQQLMQPFAETLARNGYIAVTFDFLATAATPRRCAATLPKARQSPPHCCENSAQVAACGTQAYPEAMAGSRYSGIPWLPISSYGSRRRTRCRGDRRGVRVFARRDRYQPAQSAGHRRRTRTRDARETKAFASSISPPAERRSPARPTAIFRMAPRESWRWRGASNISACSTAMTAWRKRCAGSTLHSASKPEGLHR